MTTRHGHEPQLLPVQNYSSAIAKAVEWLGDRYLLAKPINSARGDAEQTVVRMTAQRRRRSPWDV